MKYKLEMLLDRPRAHVWDAFVDVNNAGIWQPSLLRVDQIDGVASQPGAVAKLTYREGEREFSLLEKVITRQEPDRFESEFQNQFAVNTVVNLFIEHGPDQTLWITTTTYKFKTILMKVVGLLYKKNYVARSLRDMQRFKDMIEKGDTE